ncbi:hypothetical protein JHK82_055147 [Glycine max]|nr:hypothetical protein JHK86_054989 [Glycine max]KAG4917679.1 hypothetical protein JHK85_055960 [Glycine max]KAG5073778.1 hypothetical protein JHK84_055009 [Glycine max]KAG5076452.1 hypothetical protein JHK82_055147 [Glycine max]
MEDIQAFSATYRAKLDEVELAKFVPDNICWRPQPQTPMLFLPHLKPNVINTHTHSDPNGIQQRRHQNAREGFIPSNDESNMVEKFRLQCRWGHDGLEKTTVMKGSIRRGLKLGKAREYFRHLIR